MKTGYASQFHDDEILLSPHGREGSMCSLHVDDFHDPSEEEITADEIHVTCVRLSGPGEDAPFCFQLSSTSARKLVDSLTLAITKRESS
jgi:hypothetical protein